MNDTRLLATLAAAVLALIAVVYWPVHLAGFVWDDTACLKDAAPLRYGDEWTGFIFKGFCEWTNYFRPLIVALFALEVRLFNVAPEPMHLMSLAWHLANTLLVGLLARRWIEDLCNPRKSSILASFAMLIYGLHPVLIEPVAWIGSRFDLAVTFWMLLGLLMNFSVRRTSLRAFAVATCFFLGAFCKEEAVTFPLVLVLFDWLRLDSGNRSRSQALRELWKQQMPVYACIVVAGVIYLACRFLIMGPLAHPPSDQPLFSLERWQMVSYTYLTYWRIIVWPMLGLNPMHMVDRQQFAALNPTNLATDIAAGVILAFAFQQAWRRKPIGYLVLVVSAALFPVLRILPIDFNPDLYHERYAMPAIAWACVLLPRVLEGTVAPRQPRLLRWAGAGFVLIWLSLAVMNIRAALPLWSEDRKLWLWAIQGNPESQDAKSNLLSAYMWHNDRAQARLLADSLMADPHPCALCMLNVVSVALVDEDVARTSAALAKAKDVMSAESPPKLVETYIHATGMLREMQHDPQGAEEAYRDAITIEPRDPKVQMSLALLLAREGKTAEARKQADSALQLFIPAVRESFRQSFEKTLAAHAADASAPAQTRP